MKNLKGSEKQVAWAEDIRAKMEGLFDAERDRKIARAEERFAGNAERIAKTVAKQNGIRDERMAALAEIEGAKWFIDMRKAVEVDPADADMLAVATSSIRAALEQEAAMQRIRGAK